jgi:hypothetical protein
MMDRRSLIASSLAAGGLLAAAQSHAQAPAVGHAVGDPVLGPPPPGVPKIELRWAFCLSIFFKERIRIQSDSGRVFVPAAGGEIWGPRLQGRVVPYSGADYAGAHGLDATYALQASDGAMILIDNHGYMKRMDGRRTPRAVGQPRAPGQVPDQNFDAPADSAVPLRMRLMPVFDAPDGPHAWMSRTVFVGHGGRYQNPDHTIFTYYEVL